MKLATLRNGRPDGELVIVSRDLQRMLRVAAIAPTLQAAIDRWSGLAERVAGISPTTENQRLDS